MSDRALHLLDGASRGGDRQIDIDAAARAARELLLALGADLEDEGLRETPRRIVEVYAELLTPRDFAPTTFPSDEGYDELVVACDIPFHALCVDTAPARARPRVGTRRPYPRAPSTCAQYRCAACRSPARGP